MTMQSFNNFAGGYTTQQAQYTPKAQQFVSGSKNIDIYPLEENGFGFGKIAGNTEFFQIPDEKVITLFDYDTGDNNYLLTHTYAGKVYEYNESTAENTAIITGLTPALKSSFANFTIAQLTGNPYNSCFFCNGVDSPRIYIKGNTPEVQTVTAVDENGKTIKSHICLPFDGRMWMFDGNVVHWSKKNDPFVWGTPTDTGYQPLDASIIGAIVYAGTIIVHTHNGVKVITPLSDGTYTFTDLSSSNCLNYKALCRHDNSSIFLAYDGIYPVEVTQQGVRKTSNSLSNDIDKDLQAFGKATLAGAEMINVTVAGRNETWLHVPDENKSTVFIFRWKKGKDGHAYFLPPRVQQKITCLAVFKDFILSGTEDGKVLKELTGKSYDGQIIEAYGKLAKVILAGASGTQKFKPKLFVSNLISNAFYVDTILNGDSGNPIESLVIKDNSSSFVWDEDNWDEHDWATVSLNAITLRKIKTKGKKAESSVQFIFKTKGLNDDFQVHRIEFTRIKVKEK